MSEEILRALMNLFAIITKQDGGVEEKETRYVLNFLRQQLGETGTGEYFALFRQVAGAGSKINQESSETRLTSVLDSVRILGICKKINKTLNQSQKIVVLVRLFELVASDMKLTEQRMAIIRTVADVFKISAKEYDSIETFVLRDVLSFPVPDILIIDKKRPENGFNMIVAEGLDKKILILRIPDVNLYFLKYTGHDDLFLNGLGIHHNRIYLFAKGSTVKLPRGKPLYYSDVAAHFLKGSSIQDITFEARDVSFRFRSGFTGLRNIRFSAHQGNLAGILGASGTGKTTLLNVLSGIEKPTEGQVLINGVDLNREKDTLAGTIGFVPQDDLLVEELTVFDNLYFNAKLCFGGLSRDDITAKVNDTLNSLGLLDKKDLKVGSAFNKTISGGQRKRLNIAFELIREPSILFLDEPTSGLSSRDSENVMDLLRELTLKGKLIFTVIHQPSSEIFKMFDDVIILDKGGYLVYSGNPVEAVMYFKRLDAQINSGIGECPVCGNVNPEIIFNILEARVVDEYGNYTSQRKVSPAKWEEYFRQEKEMSPVKKKVSRPVASLKIPGWFKQFGVYVSRDLLAKAGNRQYVLLTFLTAPLLAFLLSYIIRYVADPSSDTYIFRENENIPIYIFMALIVAVFLGLTLSAEEIFRDRKLLKREKFLHLSRSGYLAAKITILFAISAIQALMFVAVANSILEIKMMGFYYWFAFFTTAAFANILGLNISSTFNSAITIYIVIPLLIIPMMILSGAMFSFEKLNRHISRLDKVPVPAEFMPTKWSYEALMVHQFKDNPFEKVFYSLDKQIINADFKQSYFIPELQDRLQNLEDYYRLHGNIDANDEKDDFLVLANELQAERNHARGVSIPQTILMEAGSFNREKAEKIRSVLSDLNQYYLGVFTSANTAKNNKVQNLLKNRKDIYYRYLNAYNNESVSDHVRKIYERKKLVEYDHHLVRMIDPVYLDPEPEGVLSFRTHFFAPRKYLLGHYYDTYWFNMTMIWILTALLYVLLYFNAGKRLIETDLRLWRRKRTG